MGILFLGDSDKILPKTLSMGKWVPAITEGLQL
jgi:hypothetical protein